MHNSPIDLRIELSDLLDKFSGDALEDLPLVVGTYRMNEDLSAVSESGITLYELPDYIDEDNYNDIQDVIMCLKEAAISGYQHRENWFVQSLLNDPYNDACFGEHQTKVYDMFYKMAEYDKEHNNV